jgi:phosphopantothenoylcysteine decarboxylase/phosphopantothenate--cysteine ligase
MKGKKILLGITAGIAAYKIAFLIRLLKKSGAEVKCIMTPASSDFISPLVVSTLSENPVGIEFWNKEDGIWNNHVEYGLWADVFLIAPCTANTLSKMANGSCDNLLLATYLSMRTKTIVAPAMDLDMYAHPSTKRNLQQIEVDGVQVVPAAEGELASGLSGEGRLPEPEALYEVLAEYFENRMHPAIKGQRVLVTAGPTHEGIDPVRFIGNRSTGKMGFEVAKAFLDQGAEVVLIAGPVSLELEHANLARIDVSSADEMLEAVRSEWHKCTAGVFTAAVADYKPESQADQKIKKDDSSMELNLIKNPDILKWAGENKDGQILIGFALETQDVVENATKKIQKKNLDFIVMNTLEDAGAGFGGNTNKIRILDNHNNLQEFELKSKTDVAKDIVEYLINYKK